MTVKAAPHTVLLKQMQDLFTAIVPKNRRIVQKDDFLPVTPRLQRGLETLDFANIFRSCSVP